jgi:hypothetical protein
MPGKLRAAVGPEANTARPRFRSSPCLGAEPYLAGAGKPAHPTRGARSVPESARAARFCKNFFEIFFWSAGGPEELAPAVRLIPPAFNTAFNTGGAGTAGIRVFAKENGAPRGTRTLGLLIRRRSAARFPLAAIGRHPSPKPRKHWVKLRFLLCHRLTPFAAFRHNMPARLIPRLIPEREKKRNWKP